MAANFEYWTAVFPVGIDGFSDFDHEELNAIAEQGWEPSQMTAVHGGFAVVVMFRRELDPAPARPAASRATAAKATSTTAAGRSSATKATAKTAKTAKAAKATRGGAGAAAAARATGARR